MTEFGAQLTAPWYVLDAGAASWCAAASGGDGPTWSAWSAWSSDGQLTPGILLLSRAYDSELDVIGTLLTRANIPNLRLDADRLDTAEVVSDPVRGYVAVNGCRIVPTVTWVRHFAATAIARTGHQVTDQFTRESWMAAASQIARLSAVTIAADRPGILTQQRLAIQHQVPVPRTVLTNDLSLAAQLIGSRRLIVKAAHQHFVEGEPGMLSGVFPVVVNREQLTGQMRQGSPLIVQEYVEHDTELRVYYVDGHLDCFGIDKIAPADPWLVPDQITARLVPPPPAVARATRLLAQAMSLRFAAFDFLLRDQTAIFLEANPDGDWRWLEAKVGQQPVTSAAGRMLSGLHHGTCSRPSPFNLLAFLSSRGLVPRS